MRVYRVIKLEGADIWRVEGWYPYGRVRQFISRRPGRWRWCTQASRLGYGGVYHYDQEFDNHLSACCYKDGLEETDRIADTRRRNAWKNDPCC